MAGGMDHLLSEGHEELLPRRSLALWLSGVMSVPPRDTLLGATGKNSHKHLGSRVGAQEYPVHFQKRLSSSERRSREALIPTGP